MANLPSRGSVVALGAALLGGYGILKSMYTGVFTLQVMYGSFVGV